MAKLKFSSCVVQEFFVSENHDTGAPQQSTDIFSLFFFARQFSIFLANVMHITSASRIYSIEMLTKVWQSLFQAFR